MICSSGHAPCGHVVLDVLEGEHPRVVRDRTGQPECDRVGSIRDPVQPGLFYCQHGRGFTQGRPVVPVVYLVHEDLACDFELGEGEVCATMRLCFCWFAMASKLRRWPHCNY